LAGAWADDAEVGVSDFVVEQLHRVPHAPRLEMIYNGIEPTWFGPWTRERRARCELVIGFTGRLIPGKGVDFAIRAATIASTHTEVRLLIAGDGPDRARLELLTQALGAGHLVEFLGMVSDIRAFWQRCELAVFPSQEFVEAFGMSVLEAMAASQPVVVTDGGAYPELVVNGVTGRVVPKDDVNALADAFIAYSASRELRNVHGAAGRERAAHRFPIAASARAYARLFDDVGFHRASRST
jgi:glycosyltransferase involved in cell wall biosynthesis